MLLEWCHQLSFIHSKAARLDILLFASYTLQWCCNAVSVLQFEYVDLSSDFLFSTF